MYHIVQTGSALITETFRSKAAANRHIRELADTKLWNSYEVLTDLALAERRA